jgi:hypothetical protein
MGFPNTSNNIWSHYNNIPLRETLQYVGEDGKNRFANFPIATSFDSKDNQFIEPRLLTACVDVLTGSVVWKTVMFLQTNKLQIIVKILSL